jgi:hypothetical protein
MAPSDRGLSGGIVHERCSNHPQREAAAQCMGCGRYFCRECIVEHDGKMTCASCLKKSGRTRAGGRLRLKGTVRAAQAAAALTVLWLFFYLLGGMLMAVPDSFHEGTMWEQAGGKGK